MHRLVFDACPEPPFLLLFSSALVQFQGRYAVLDNGMSYLPARFFWAGSVVNSPNGLYRLIASVSQTLDTLLVIHWQCLCARLAGCWLLTSIARKYSRRKSAVTNVNLR